MHEKIHSFVADINSYHNGDTVRLCHLALVGWR